MLHIVLDKMKKNSLKIKFLLSLFFCFLIFLTLITSDTGLGIKNNIIIKISDIPDQYKAEIENLKIEIEHIKINANDRLYQSYAKNVAFDSEMIASSFFGNEYQKNIDENGVICISNKKKLLNMCDDRLEYFSNSKLQKYVSKNFVLNKSDKNVIPFHVYPKYKNHILKAEKKIEKLIKGMGIENLVWRKSFEWEDCTYWLGIQECQGIPVFTTVYYEGMNDEWMPFQVLNSLEGIERARVFYCFQFEQKKERIKLLDFEEIVNSLVQEYAMILTDNKHDVVGAELFFWVDVNQEKSEYKMEPVWVFTIHEYCEGEKENYSEYQEIIHAETGKCVEVRE